MFKILLGSNSPRRNELLAQMGYDFTKVSINCDESFDSEMDALVVAEYLSKKKSNSYDRLSHNEVLITADTVVISEGIILNKPADEREAELMLDSLNGKTHQVCTGVTLRSLEKGLRSFRSTTSVSIASMSPEEIRYYIQNYKPFDKAGSYGIQEWYGLSQVTSINGSFYNVVGLPTQELYMHLKEDYGI